MVRTTRRLAGRYIWTQPNIARTFRCRPAYQASFKKAWLSLMWGGEVERRRLREAIAEGRFAPHSSAFLERYRLQSSLRA